WIVRRDRADAFRTISALLERLGLFCKIVRLPKTAIDSLDVAPMTLLRMVTHENRLPERNVCRDASRGRFVCCRFRFQARRTIAHPIETRRLLRFVRIRRPSESFRNFL